MSNHDKPTINAAPDGPLLVNNLSNLSNRHGPLETSPSMALCRCGASKNKPFCDGSHQQIGFKSTRAGNRPTDQRIAYVGKHITIYDNRSLCAHAGYCTDSLASVFRLKQEPWIDPDGAPVDEIIAAIKRCPSGALSYSVEGVTPSAPVQPGSILIAPNGPYVVSGEVELAGIEWGEGASRLQYTLCRCGASHNKPFCDGSHWAINFSDDKN